MGTFHVKGWERSRGTAGFREGSLANTPRRPSASRTAATRVLGAGLGALTAHLTRMVLEDPAIKARIVIAMARHPKAVKTIRAVGRQIPGGTMRAVEGLAAG